MSLRENSSGKYNGSELDYVAQALDSSNVDNKKSPWTQRFESAFARKIGSRYAIAHNSGTSALHSCLAAAGVGPGDEVISPALTVVMDAYVTLHLGATPVFADVDAGTQNIDPEDVRRKITARTKAIMTVSLQGLPADVAPILRLAEEHGVVVIEDCAQTMLARYPMPDGSSRVSGTIGHLGAFSFESKKHLSTGEGGMVVTDDAALAERVRKFGGIGYKNLTAEAGRMSILPETFQDPLYERFDTLGLNYRMPEVVAAVGFAQLDRIDLLLERRGRVADSFRRAVAGCSWMVPQEIPRGYAHSYYTFSVQYHGAERFGISWKDFWRRYKDMGGDGFYGACRPPYLEPVFKSLDKEGQRYAPGLCPVAEEIQLRIMQFKTNYRDLARAEEQAGHLARLIDEIGR